MRKRIVAILALGFLWVTGARGQMPPDPEQKRDNPTGNTGALKGQIQTGGSYDAHSGNGTRVVTDLRVPGALGEYGLDFTRYWNSTHNDYDDSDAEWPTDFGQSGWSHSWRWAAVVGYQFPDEIPGTNNHNNIYKTTITITFPDGHTTKYKISRVGHGQWLVPPGDPVWGPPYTTAEIQSSWPYGGIGVHDHICNMATDGSEFWLCRADGGSVHFQDGPENYRATEVFDPHGLKTTLRYNTSGLLDRVEQEGGGYLFITWSFFEHTGWLITRVDTGGAGGGGSQHVVYQYRLQGGYYHVLTLVRYDDDPAPGQTAVAVYTYGSCWGDETAGCASSGVPMLKRADDPRYGGAMTKIRYHYNGEGCAPILINPWAYPEWVGAQPYAIAAEKSDAGDVVSSFSLGCDNGLREEYNGLGGHRKFYFGNSANTDETGLHCRGFQLGKVTDFTTAGPIGEGTPCPPGLACRRQNFSFGDPRHIWDGRNIMTNAIPGADDSGLPAEIHHPDGSAEFYNRLDSSGSDALDSSCMHNSYHHWLFRRTDERNQTTLYKRDPRRRVKQIDYPGGGSESYTYNGFNQVETQTLPSRAVQHYEHDGFHRLYRTWNSVDGPADYTEYTYDTLDRVAKVENPLARSRSTFTAKMEYNGRNLVTKVTYPATGSEPADPFVTYEYDNYGNCTAITNELGHRSTYTYDAYRRCTSYTEPLNAPGWNGGGNVASRTWNWVYDRVAPNGVDTFPAAAHTSSKWRLQIEPPFNSTGDRRATARDYDCNDRLNFEFVGIIVPAASPNGPWIYDEGAMHRYAYDGNGQKRSYVDPKNRETTYEYDNRNRLWKSNEYPNPNTGVPRTTVTMYNAAGDKTKVTFPDGKMQEWPDSGYDAFGQPHVFIDERIHTTNLDYLNWGPMKKLLRVTTHRAMDVGGTEHQETQFDYDLMGRPQWTTFPDTTTEQSAYEFGQLSAFKTRRDQTKRLHYDARGREDYHTWDAGAAPRIDRTWDRANRLARIWNSFSIIDYQYDEAGQMRTEGTTVTGSGAPREVRYSRYPSGEVSQTTYPNGSTIVGRKYTARGQLQRTEWTGGSVDYIYLSDGKVDYEDYGNGVRSDLGYNERGFINLTNTYRQSPVQTYAKRDYWRDDRDRIKGWKKGNDVSANPMEDGRGDRYDYDEEGQLTRASYQLQDPENNATGALRSDSFTYDELGNRVRWNYIANRGAMDFKRRNNKLNQYESWENNYPVADPQHWGSAIYYDDSWGSPPGPPSPPWIPPGNGVTMADGWLVASYNALNQPIAIGNIGFGSNYMWFWHDPLGRCVKRWMGTGNQTPVGSDPITYFYYDGWNLIQEGPNATTAERVYVHGNRVDEIVASSATGAGWLYHHYDARGHCILQTNASGGLQEQYDYDAFGWPYFYTATGAPAKVYGKPGSPSGNRFLFTGREFLSRLRIYDYRNRMYQPELGRFLQPDPKHFGAGDYNLYRYCHNDPVNNSDPFGLRELAAGVIDVDDKVLKQTYDNAKKAAEDSLKNTDRRTQTERRIDTYKDANGKVRSTGETKGYKYPSPQAPPPKLPAGVSESQRTSQAHDHVGAPARHYGGDKGSANDIKNPNGAGLLPLASSVSSTVDRGGTQEFYIPSSNLAERAANTGGAYFFTSNGIDFTPAPYH